MKKRRILTALLAMVMLLSAVPFGAMAADKAPAAPAAPEVKGNTYLSKKATLENDGSYTIDMEAYATGKTEVIHKEEAVPLDIVLVLDQSLSMKGDINGEETSDKSKQKLGALKTAALKFVDNIVTNGSDPKNPVDHRVAVVGFASNNHEKRQWEGTGLFDQNGKFQKYGKDTNSKCVLTPDQFKNALVAANKSSLKTAINSLDAAGDTFPEYGLEMANKIFENNPIPAESNRKRVVVMFTDGVPAGYNTNKFDENSANRAREQAQTAKTQYNATVYTIGLLDKNADQKVHKYLHDVSSGPDKGEGQIKVETTVVPAGYEPIIGELNTEKTYYVKNASGKYVQVEYKKVNKKTKKYAWVDGDHNRYDPAKVTFCNKTSQHEVLATNSKYYLLATDIERLNAIFDTISQDISKPSTSVTLDAKSILRDIMSQEGFKLTSQSKVIVSIVPGTTTDDKTYQWGTPTEILTLTNPTDSASKTGTYGNMTIQASTHMANPEAGKKDLDTVDVTGFDYKDQYISTGHAGSKLVVKITGVKALPSVTTDKNIYTNFDDPAQPDNKSGIWSPKETHAGKYVMELAFPEQPQTHMTSKAYVVDYAKPLDLSIADFKMTKAKTIDMDGYDPFTAANYTITHKYGDVKLEGGKLTYTPKTMNWDGYDTFYVFGTTSDATVKAASANANGNVWAKVNVIPANNVYYEDTFTSNESNGTVGITYTGEWTEVKGTEPIANGGAAEGNPDTDNHGWIPALENENGDTDGSSSHADVTGGNTATATFTFTGTGVDVYSRTNGQTGTVAASLYSEDGKLLAKQIIDTMSVSDEYYQVPTLSFHKDNQKVDLPHATYKVVLKVTNLAAERLNYYLDGIRVYNPLGSGHDAYAPDEKNAKFLEIRDMLLDSTNVPANGVFNNGAVFIDQIKEVQVTEVGTGTTTTVVGTYKD